MSKNVKGGSFCRLFWFSETLKLKAISAKRAGFFQQQQKLKCFRVFIVDAPVATKKKKKKKVTEEVQILILSAKYVYYLLITSRFHASCKNLEVN